MKTPIAILLFFITGTNAMAFESPSNCSAYCTFKVHGSKEVQTYGRNISSSPAFEEGMILVTGTRFEELQTQCEEYAQSVLKNQNEHYGEVSVFSTAAKDWVPVYVNFGHYRFRKATAKNSCVE